MSVYSECIAIQSVQKKMVDTEFYTSRKHTIIAIMDLYNINSTLFNLYGSLRSA